MVQQALVDTGVLYSAFQRRDQYHDTGLSIVRAADRRELPVLVVLDFVLAETMNGLTQELPHDDATRSLAMIEQSAGFEIRRTTSTVWARGIAIYRDHAHLSFVDSLLVAYAREHDEPPVYSFDAGFDSVDGVRRLNTNVDPYEP